MHARALKRLLMALPGVVLVVSAVFLLIRVVPGDPITALLGEQATVVDRQAMAAALGLDKPWWLQLWNNWKGVLGGYWGESMMHNKPVLEVIGARALPSLVLGLAAMAVAVGVGLAGGLLLALGGKGWQRTWEGLLVAVMAVPTFVLGPLLMLLVSVRLGWLPVSGFESWQGVVLPALTLGAALGCGLARMLGESLREQGEADYARTVVAKGGSPCRRWYHVLRNALIPAVVLLCLQLGMVLTGVVLTEAVFGWPGIGTLLVEGLHGRDYPLVQGVMLVIAVGYVLANTLADVLVAVLDRRAARTARRVRRKVA